ncbi:serine/threonine-protein kinase ATR-like isoform X2 [Rhopilema esculentum]|uniref:serine/threonine-protein kinase ATR-like isoform X2 n=1 Tax=Rhopilema esculentum TaxID=499914 RepID=UPI0031D0A200
MITWSTMMHVNRRESENMDDNATPTSSSSVFQLKVSPALLELKDKYRDIDTLSTQEHNMSTQATRDMICNCVNNLLTDLASVGAQLKRETGGSPQSEVALQFFHHCVDAQPYLYISTETIQCGLEKMHSEDGIEEILCDVATDFTRWLISRLLRILSSKQCTPLHEKSIDVIHAIFQLYMGRDIVLYRRLVSELISLTVDLTVLMENVFLNGNSELQGNTFGLERFQKVQSLAENQESDEHNEDTMYAKLIEIETISECDLLLSCCFTILEKSVHGLCLYCGSLLENLWNVITFRLRLELDRLPKTAVSLTRVLLKTCGILMPFALDNIQSAMLCCLGNLVDQSNIDEREGDEQKLFEKELRITFDCIFNKRSNSSTYSLPESKAFVWKIGSWIADKPMKSHLQDLICFVGRKIIATLCNKDSTGVSSNVLKDLARSLIEKLGTSDSPEVFASFITEIAKVLEANVNKLPLKRTAAVMESSDRLHLKSARVASSIGEMLLKKISVLGAELTGFDRDVQNSCELIMYLRGIKACIEIYYNTNSHGQCQKDFLSCLEDISNGICALVYDKQTLNYEVQQKSHLLILSIQILDHAVAMFNSNSVKMAAPLYNFLAEVVYLPWTESIDPPWFDWKPEVHKENEIKTVRDNLAPCLATSFITTALSVILKLPISDHMLWKVHIFRTALVHPDAQVQKTAIRCLPALLAIGGESSYCLLTEEVSSLIRSARTTVRSELAKICGDVVCALAKCCRIEFAVVLQDEGEMSLDADQFKSFQLICQACKEGIESKEHPDISLLRSFFQLLKPDSPRDVKLPFVENLRHFMVHLAHEKESSMVTTFLWTPILNFMEDDDVIVRIAFSQVVSVFLMRKDLVHIQQLLFVKLKSSFRKASRTGDAKMLETIVMTLGSVGQAAQGDLLLIVVISLLDCLTTQHQSIGPAAYDQIHVVASHHQLKCSEILFKYRSQVCEFLISQFREAIESGKDSACLEELIAETASVFDIKDSKTFLQEQQSILLPRVMRSPGKSSSTILRVIAKQLEINRREMLFFNFRFIFSFLIRSCSGIELKKTLDYLETETDVQLSSLLLSECQHVFNQLLLYLSVNKEQVFTGLTILAHNDANYSGPKEIKSDQEMAIFLKPRLLGVLAFFNSVLIYGDAEEKRLALQSLVSLMQVMGPEHVTVVRLKIMAILRLGMKIEGDSMAELCCSGWDYFVHNVDLKTLGPLLGQIVVTLFPLLDKFSDKVASIFKYLIIENKGVMKEFFKDIYYLPNNPVLNEVNDVINSCNAVVRSKRDYFRDQLALTTEGVKHENADVKKYALKRLAELLSKHQAFLLDFILSSESVHPAVINLFSVLMSSCKEADEETRNLIGVCFGHLGAVDPGRLEISSDGFSGDNVIYQNGVEDLNFAVDLINELCRAFLAASDTRAQDCSAYAIQEVLQFYNCSDTSHNKIWQKFPEQTQEVLRPHLHSKYLHSSSDSWANLPRPLFGSSKGRNFKEWACTWVGVLISKSSDKKISGALRPCTSIVKHDLKMANFILPHAAFFAIVENDSVAQEVLSEIETVLHAVLGKKPGFATMSAQAIYSLLDFLNAWIDEGRQARFKASGQVYSGVFQEKIEQKIFEFINGISKKLLSSVAFTCKATPRALMYLESYIDNNDEKLQENLDMLQRIYYALDEPDGINGVAAARKVEVSLKAQILDHESSGRLRDAAACYEKAIQQEMNDVTHHQGLLQCLIRLGQLNTALMDASGIVTKRPLWKKDILPYQSEAAWRLGQWDTLRENLDGVSEFDNWSISLGKLLVYVKDQRIDDLHKHLQLARQEQMKPLSASGLDLGDKSYECIVRLHMLQEVEQFATLLIKRNSQDIRTQDLIKTWEQRYQSTQASYRIREEILSLRRVLLDLLPSHSNAVINEQDNCWLRIAKIARKAGHIQTAYSSLLNVRETNRTDTIIERTKWLWSQGDRHKALLCLEKDASYIQSCQGREDIGSTYSKQNVAKVLLLVGRWMEETESHEPQPILNQYKDVVNKCGDWEKGHFFLAKYYEKVMNAYDDKSKTKVTDFIPFVIRHHASSLQYGCKYLYQSMPTLLTLWLDFGVKAYNIQQDKESNYSKQALHRDRLNSVNQVIKDFTSSLPAYQFLTAFSQIISRICHPSPSVWEILGDLISKIFLAYKDQAFWKTVAVSKSSFRSRKDRCSELFNRICMGNKTMRQFIEHGLRLTDRLLEVCNKPCRKETKLTISADFPSLKRLLNDTNFSSIIIPLQSTMTVILPSGQSAQPSYNPFPDSLPTFAGFDEAVDVLRSLQKPKKIVIIGSDGKRYPMMCKPKDDLRKDCRLMEFNSLVNKLLQKDTECRRRQLHIRTYAVIPLSEECGILEWVSNTAGLRQITDNLFKEKNMLPKIQDLKRLYNNMTTSDLRTKMEMFKNQVLPRYPPVFQEWFLRTFPNPSKWYMARLAYCRTTAVMSMVGYILGLGDRHGENILFDSTTGDCFHVDFNCLFNKGETFECPERVPFRLTNQLVSAMGPLGYEGVFRRSCEVTMKLMRTQRDSLLSVLNTFIYDPLVEWTKDRRKQSVETGENTNEKAMSILRNVEDRLAGYCVSMKNLRLNLSIEGQVHQLIKEATSLENLSQMYIGWAAYL